MTFSDPLSALKSVFEFLPDVIISEMILPNMSGIDFMRRVKIDLQTAEIPFVFLSYSRDVENKILALSLGAKAVFAKPLFIEDLMQNISDLLDESEGEKNKKQHKNFLEGDVSDISILNVLSIFLEGGNSGEVEFSSSESKKGVVFCDSGNVVRVETSNGENSDGMEELYNIISWPDGEFSITYKDVDVKRNICLPQKKIIEKSVTWFKEYSEILRGLPPLDTVVYLDFANFVENLNKLPDESDFVVKNISESGSRISEIIDSCGTDRKMTATYLKQLVDLSVVSIENVQSTYEIPPIPKWMPPKKGMEPFEINIEVSFTEV